jgi:hypothetical protein
LAILSGRWTVEDSDLGHCTVFRGSLPIAGVLAGVGVAMVLLFGFASWSNDYWSPAGLFTLLLLPAVFLLLAFSYWRTELLVGEKGFRLKKGWRPIQGPLEMAWSQVATSELGSQADRRGTKAWLVVRDTNGGKTTISQQFTATFWEIRDAMEASREASSAADTQVLSTS